MKRLLLLLALCLVVGSPVMGTALTYQNGVSYTNLSFGSVNATYVNNATGGNSYLHVPRGAIAKTPTNAYPTQYAAGTVVSADYFWGGPYVILYSNTYSQLATYGCDANALSICNDPFTRYEVKVVGSTAYIYVNGILASTTTSLSQNPSYVGFSQGGLGGSSTNWDDIVYGESESKYIVGVPAAGAYYVKKDFVNPASYGLFNATTGDLIYSDYLPITWGRSNLTSNVNESINLVNVDDDTIYGSLYTGNATAGIANFDIYDVFISDGTPYGNYVVKFGDYESDIITFIADGAEISWDKDDYSKNQDATITYSIYADYWDTSTYTYSIKVYDGTYWNLLQTTPISASSGTVTYSFTDDSLQGEYYAAVTATPNAGGDEAWLILDHASLSGYVTFTGYVNGAEIEAPIDGATVSFVQGDIVSSSVTIADGNYTATGFISGAQIAINVTATGYHAYNVSMIPMVFKEIPLNITLNSTTPTSTGLGIGGVARTGIFTNGSITNGYGQPISGATVMLINTSNSESYTKATNMAGWYLCDEGAFCFLTTGRPYDVWGSKLGYSNSQNYTAVAA